MAYFRKLGIFVKAPQPGGVKTRLVPPLSANEACELYSAFVADLFTRLSRLKKVDVTVFLAGDDSALLRAAAPDRFQWKTQVGETLGARLEHAFSALLDNERDIAVVIGSDSPDIPLTFLKRAYLKLKHKDVVLGPSSDGGYYLIGMRKVAPPLLADIPWSTDAVLRETLERVRAEELSFSMLPLWYDVDSVETLSLMKSMLLARRLQRSDRLLETERVFDKLKQI